MPNSVSSFPFSALRLSKWLKKRYRDEELAERIDQIKEDYPTHQMKT
jgi:hypothetical protein